MISNWDLMESQTFDLAISDEDVINDTLQDIDVIGIIGDGATRKVLQNAGIEECDLLIALTGSDELNIYCCLLGKRLGAKSTIARVRDPEYSKDVGLLKENLGLALAINPEREAAAEIQRILRFPTARNVDFFGHGKVDLLSFVAHKNCRYKFYELKIYGIAKRTYVI